MDKKKTGNLIKEARTRKSIRKVSWGICLELQTKQYHAGRTEGAFLILEY